jgi:hypothetical protein
VLLLNECLLLFISLSIQSGNFWIHLRISPAASPSPGRPLLARHFMTYQGSKFMIYLCSVVKVKMFLCLIKHLAMKTFGGVEV